MSCSIASFQPVGVSPIRPRITPSPSSPQSPVTAIRGSRWISGERSKIVEEACADLTVHTQLEEQVSYPAVRRALEETDLVSEAEVEHDVAKELIEKLKGMRSDNGEYSATFTVLSEYVGHHIEEEQNELFPAARKTGLDFNALAEEMRQRKKELREELGLEPEAAAQRAGRASRKTTSSRPATR